MNINQFDNRTRRNLASICKEWQTPFNTLTKEGQEYALELANKYM